VLDQNNIKTYILKSFITFRSSSVIVRCEHHSTTTFNSTLAHILEMDSTEEFYNNGMLHVTMPHQVKYTPNHRKMLAQPLTITHVNLNPINSFCITDFKTIWILHFYIVHFMF